MGKKIVRLSESDLFRIVKKVIKESSQVQPKFDSSKLISLSQNILKNAGLNVDVQDYVKPGENPMCVPQNDENGILSKIFDFLNNLGTTDEIEKQIYTLSKGTFNGITLTEDQKNEAVIIAAGLVAADNSELPKEEVQEQGINYAKRRKQQARRAKKWKCPRSGK